MFTVTRTGRAQDIAAEIRAVPTVAVPKAAAKALTFTAQAAQKSIVAAMGSTFKGGATRYTLNSTRIEPATVEDLSARVAVKDRTTNNGTLPEDYLYPQVYGGQRKEKRMERNLRYAGILAAGKRAVLGKDTPANLVDSFGNLKYGEIQRILTAVKASFDRGQNRTDSKRSKRNARNAPYFVAGLPGGRFEGGEFREVASRVQPGIYRRVGDRKVVPVLIFVSKKPTYKPRLNFEDIARETAQREFEPIFRRLLAKENA